MTRSAVDAVYFNLSRLVQIIPTGTLRPESFHQLNRVAARDSVREIMLHSDTRLTGFHWKNLSCGIMFLASSMFFYANDSSLAEAEPPRVASWTPALALQVRRIGSVQVSPDGAQAAYTVRHAVMTDDKSEYLTHIHLATTDGKRSIQLTQGEKSCDDPQWSPDGDWIAFLSNRTGKKNLWLIRPTAGEALQLTDSKSDVTSFRWSADGKKIAFTATDPVTAAQELKERGKDDARVLDENPKFQRLFVVQVNSPPTLQPQAETLVSGEFHVDSESRAGRAGFDWSPDGKLIAFTHTKTPSVDDWPTSQISLVDVASRQLTRLPLSAASHYSPLFSPDGKQIAFLTSNLPATWAGARSIQVIATEGGEPRKLADTWDGFGRYSELVGWSSNGRQIYFTEAHRTRLRLMAMPLNGAPLEISQDSGMSLGGVGLNVRRTHFGFSWEKLDAPPEAFVAAIDPFEPKKISQVNRDLPALASVRTEHIRWKSTDGLEIEGLLTYPSGYVKTQKYPLLLIIHGGPMGVFMQTFDGIASTYPVAVFAAQGYAVLRANVRGSSGYGTKFRHANYVDWGGGDYHDLMEGVDHVIKLGVADESRLGVMGWSYGGFMTSWIITQTKRFKAASVGAGVTNLVSFTGTADIPGFLPDYFAGEYWDRPGLYEKHSAMFQIKGVTTPTLIQHGEKDERVPLSQGLEFYNALKRQGCVTKMVIYPRTPHSVDEPKLLLDCMNRNLAWFGQYNPASASLVEPK